MMTDSWRPLRRTVLRGVADEFSCFDLDVGVDRLRTALDDNLPDCDQVVSSAPAVAAAAAADSGAVAAGARACGRANSNPPPDEPARYGRRINWSDGNGADCDQLASSAPAGVAVTDDVAAAVGARVNWNPSPEELVALSAIVLCGWNALNEDLSLGHLHIRKNPIRTSMTLNSNLKH